jgi:CPA1 family monovalent cation:H+ antiporter
VPNGAVLVAGLARWLEVPYPALLALAGAGLAFLPFAPAIEIEPDLALALFVAPVLLDAAFDTSPRDLKRSVASLAVVALNFAVAGFPFPEPLPSTE